MNKGFTLIEMLGVIVILSIIMLIAIPNIASTLENSKKQTYLKDAKTLIAQAQYAIRTSIEKPGDNELLKITLEDLGTSDIDKDPDGDSYSLTDSYVIVTRNSGYLVYYVNLVAEKNGSNKGISLKSEEDLNEQNRLSLVENNIPTWTMAKIIDEICSSCTEVPITMR